MTTDTVTLTIDRIIHAPRERVFQSFTDPGQFGQWWGPDGTMNTDVAIDASVGGRYEVCMNLPATYQRESVRTAVSGEFTDVDAHRVLGYTFQWEGQDRITQVTVDFEDREAGGTELTVRHEGLPAVEFAEYEQGWNASLDRLQALLE